MVDSLTYHDKVDPACASYDVSEFKDLEQKDAIQDVYKKNVSKRRTSSKKFLGSKRKYRRKESFFTALAVISAGIFYFSQDRYQNRSKFPHPFLVDQNPKFSSASGKNTVHIAPDFVKQIDEKKRNLECQKTITSGYDLTTDIQDVNDQFPRTLKTALEKATSRKFSFKNKEFLLEDLERFGRIMWFLCEKNEKTYCETMKGIIGEITEKVGCLDLDDLSDDQASWRIANAVKNSYDIFIRYGVYPIHQQDAQKSLKEGCCHGFCIFTVWKILENNRPLTIKQMPKPGEICPKLIQIMSEHCVKFNANHTELISSSQVRHHIDIPEIFSLEWDVNKAYFNVEKGLSASQLDEITHYINEQGDGCFLMDQFTQKKATGHSTVFQCDRKNNIFYLIDPNYGIIKLRSFDQLIKCISEFVYEERNLVILNKIIRCKEPNKLEDNSDDTVRAQLNRLIGELLGIPSRNSSAKLPSDFVDQVFTSLQGIAPKQAQELIEIKHEVQDLMKQKAAFSFLFV